jgi:hypothetical protein
VCDAVGQDTTGGHALVAVVTNGAPGATHVLTALGGFYGSGCIGTKCVAVGPGSTEGGYSLLTNGVPAAPKFLTGTAFLLGVACGTAKACDAVGLGSNHQGVVAVTPA